MTSPTDGSAIPMTATSPKPVGATAGGFAAFHAEHAPRRMGLDRAPTAHELAGRFTYHAPKPGQPAMYESVREKARDLATIMAAYCPPSDELAKALDHLDNAVFNANAAIARHG